VDLKQLPPGDDKLMAYFMGQTNERLGQIESKLAELIAFRAEVLASAKATSFVMSAVSGVIVLLASWVMKRMGVS
jgi:hypothetical protein